MPYEALPLTDKISQKSSRVVNYRALTSTFGDGYRQDVPDGINTRFERWTIYWENLNSTERATLWAFFDTVQGTQPCKWTPFGDSAEKLFKVITGVGASHKQDIEESFMAGEIFSIKCVIEQVYGV